MVAKNHSKSRLFSGAKAARVLERMGVEYDQFCDLYDQERRAPRIKALSDNETILIQRFYIEHRSVTRLAEDLKCSTTAAQAKATRYAILFLVTDPRKKQAEDLALGSADESAHDTERKPVLRSKRTKRESSVPVDE